MTTRELAVLLIAAAALAGCQSQWTLTKVATVEGLDRPESVAIDPAAGVAYASSTAPGNPPDYWAANHAGFITRISPELKADPLRWVADTNAMPLHAPKGVCLYKGLLHVADRDRIRRYDVATGKPAPALTIPGATRLNDLLVHEGALWTTDTGLGKAYRFGADPAKPLAVQGPTGINGIAFWRGRMFAVSWDKHEIYELDPTGEAPARALGLADQLQNLDEVKILDDGTMIVSDYVGNRIVAVSPDHKTVRPLAEVTTPADLGLDRKRMRLYVPAMKANAVVIYDLKRK